MIKGIHTMFYSSEPENLRMFLRDKLGFNKFTDAGEGWLIFDMPSADIGVHPVGGEDGALSGTAHISFFCEDIHETVAELKSKGVTFQGEIEDHGYGWVTFFSAPGEFVIQLYEPKYGK